MDADWTLMAFTHRQGNGTARLCAPPVEVKSAGIRLRSEPLGGRERRNGP
jgi:hypothetical protein